MNVDQDHTRLAQSASALGAGILGFGLGTKWGSPIIKYSLIIIIVGAIFHVLGMYITQMRKSSDRDSNPAKALWISAWICLIILIAIIVYLSINDNATALQQSSVFVVHTPIYK